MTQMTKAEAAASIRSVADKVREDIARLERWFAVTSIDAWPFVVVLESENSSHISALKSLPGNCYNFSANGLDATQYSRASAEAIAADITANDDMGRKCRAEGKYQYFTRVLEVNRTVLQSFEEMLAA